MSTKRIRHTAKFKFSIALEAIKSDKTISQLASDHQLHPSQPARLRDPLCRGMPNSTKCYRVMIASGHALRPHCTAAVGCGGWRRGESIASLRPFCQLLRNVGVERFSHKYRRGGV